MTIQNLGALSSRATVEIRDGRNSMKVGIDELIEAVANKVIDQLDTRNYDHQEGTIDYGVDLSHHTAGNVARASMMAQLTRSKDHEQEAHQLKQEARIKAKLAASTGDADRAEQIYDDSQKLIAGIVRDLDHYQGLETIRNRGIVKKVWHWGKNEYDQDEIADKYQDLVSKQHQLRQIFKDNELGASVVRDILADVPQEAQDIYHAVTGELNT